MVIVVTFNYGDYLYNCHPTVVISTMVAVANCFDNRNNWPPVMGIRPTTASVSFLTKPAHPQKASEPLCCVDYLAVPPHSFAQKNAPAASGVHL